VLGLTLAEVLVLLLFLLLLALGNRLNKLQQAVAAAQEKRDNLSILLDHSQVELSQVKSLLPKSLTEEEARSLLKEMPELKWRASKLQEELQNVEPALAEAARIVPNDPATVLKRAVELLTGAQKSILIRQLAEKHKDVETGSIEKPAISRDGHNWPPIITLSEARGYFFPSGSAEVTPEFREKLSEVVVGDIMKIIEQYQVDVVEVVGHTDEQKLMVRPSNLDTVLIPFLRGDQGIERFAPSDNAGLGLARAAAVLRILADDPRLKNVKLLPLSGGQVIEVGDSLSMGKSPGNVRERRRIEIRARRSDGAGTGWHANVTDQ
jgi:flagellar motor protein MotB